MIRATFSVHTHRALKSVKTALYCMLSTHEIKLTLQTAEKL